MRKLPEQGDLMMDHLLSVSLLTIDINLEGSHLEFVGTAQVENDTLRSALYRGVFASNVIARDTKNWWPHTAILKSLPLTMLQWRVRFI
jgi:hypothetical protein